MLILPILLLILFHTISAFTIYDVSNSGWKSPDWNWGSSVGTGHDCALICRQRYQSASARRTLLQNLLTATNTPENFEEVKLILGLTFQNAKWTGRDGGPGGYGDVLATMAEAQRYEDGSDPENARALVNDMAERFHLLEPKKQQEMDAVWREDDYDYSRRKCAGLVLEAMEFLEYGC